MGGSAPVLLEVRMWLMCRVVLFLVVTLLCVEGRAIGSLCPLNGSCACLFSSIGQVLLPMDAVRMEEMNVVTREICLEFTPFSGEIVFLKAGVYKITWNAEAHSSYAWSLGLTIDDRIIPGSVCGIIRVYQ